MTIFFLYVRIDQNLVSIFWTLVNKHNSLKLLPMKHYWSSVALQHSSKQLVECSGLTYDNIPEPFYASIICTCMYVCRLHQHFYGTLAFREICIHTYICVLQNPSNVRSILDTEFLRYTHVYVFWLLYFSQCFLSHASWPTDAQVYY